ncbi:MAG TPA: PAS domain S-box protein, partial [Gemmataceae bacterium]|nr:PAS domain S-box protein [Gemmataceae bacterium]
MTVDVTPARPQARPPWVGYAGAGAAVAAATLARLALAPVLGDSYPFAVYLGAIAVVACFGRTPHAAAAVVLAGLVASYVFLPPRYSFGFADGATVVGLVVFMAVGAVIVAMGHGMRAARGRAEALLADVFAREAELRRAVAAEAEQRERLRTTLVSIGDAVITTDTAGRVTNLNAVAEALTGWSDREAAGHPLDAVFRIVTEATRRPVENPVARALRDGRIVGLANHTVLIARDGTERPIDDSAAPIRCKAGEVVGCVLVFRDISERKREEVAQAERT